jgi:hypothetical protein
MAVYIGLMGKDTRIENCTVVGGSVEILCNPIKNLEGIDMPLKYRLDSSYLDLADCFSTHEQYPGFSSLMTYCDILKDVASRRRINEPVILLTYEADFSINRSLCGASPSSDKVYVARVSRKDIAEKLDKFGRRFA